LRKTLAYSLPKRRKGLNYEHRRAHVDLQLYSLGLTSSGPLTVLHVQ
jgi:hypothetical protein